ncbi:MAG: heat-inducible transcriptional repressor HrcA [Magnetospiraceae bacterium]
MITELNDRAREIMREIVQSYLETGEPVGSRTLSKVQSIDLSPASIRNVMADLEDLGLLYAPHKSAGRLPTDTGLRLYVDGLLEVGNLTKVERAAIEAQCKSAGRTLEAALTQATETLSGLSNCAGLVAAPKGEAPLRHIEFVSLNPGRAMAILVGENGVVENRVVSVPADLAPSTLVQASNFLSARLVGKTLAEGLKDISADLETHRSELDALTSRVVEAGLATWTGGSAKESLIVRGQAHLLEDVGALTDLERIRGLFEVLETKEAVLKLMNLADSAEGVQIFIGADNPLFAEAGCSMVVAPFRDGEEKIVGAIGVIGPTRLNYARIIPMVDFTAKIVGRLIG